MAITYNALYFAFTFGFTYFYTAITFDVNEVADNLKRYSSFIPGIRPGRPTADYLASVMNRVTFAGACFLGFITVILPIATAKISGIPHQQMYLGGTAILIVLCFALDTMKQPQSERESDALDALMCTLSARLDLVLYIKDDTGDRRDRLSGRLVCPKWQRMYPPGTVGYAMACPNPVQQADDKADAVRPRTDISL